MNENHIGVYIVIFNECYETAQYLNQQIQSFQKRTYCEIMTALRRYVRASEKK